MKQLSDLGPGIIFSLAYLFVSCILFMEYGAQPVLIILTVGGLGTLLLFLVVSWAHATGDV